MDPFTLAQTSAGFFGLGIIRARIKRVKKTRQTIFIDFHGSKLLNVCLVN